MYWKALIGALTALIDLKFEIGVKNELTVLCDLFEISYISYM